MEPALTLEQAQRAISHYAIGSEVVDNKVRLWTYEALSYEQAKVISVLEFGEVDETIDDATLIQTIVNYLNNNEDIKNLTAKSWQYLVSKNFIVPIFIEPGHSLNGANLIELGYATNYTTGSDVVQ